MDSFWRQYTAPSTRDLVQYQSFADLILYVNNRSKYSHLRGVQNVNEITPFVTTPWYPVVLYQSRLSQNSYPLYGEGYHYSSMPEIVYGQKLGTRVVVTLQAHVVDPGLIFDAVVDSTVCIDSSQYRYDTNSGRLYFNVDPFTLITNRTTSTGEVYIIIWLKNSQLNLDAPYDQVGWVIGYEGINSLNYVESLKYLWKMILKGANLRDYQNGLISALGFPVVTSTEEVQYVADDLYRNLIITPTSVYAHLTEPAVTTGDTIYPGQSIFSGIAFFEYEQILAATRSQIPGLACTLPTRSGFVVQLVFVNDTVFWTYDANRDSPFRFPVGGSPADVELFWTDVQAYLTETGFDITNLIDTSSEINPMRFLVQNIIKNNIFITSVDLTCLTSPIPGFADRVRSLISPATLLILNQKIGETSDTLELDSEIVETIQYGYSTSLTEVIAPTGSGFDLVYTDLVPFVVIG